MKNLDLFKMKYINHIVQRIPNFSKVYCVFECDENESNFDTNYFKVVGFCNKTSDEFKIILEIMKLYKNKLSEYKNKLSLDQIKPILKQLIFALMYAFESQGFIHGDLHIENILIDKFSNNIKLNYNIDKKQYTIKTNEKYIIMDFDKSITYETTYLKLPSHCDAMTGCSDDNLNNLLQTRHDRRVCNKLFKLSSLDIPNFTREFTLIFSITKIIYICASLFKKKNKFDQDPLNIALDKTIKNIHFDIIAHGTSILGSYYQESRNYKDFINETIMDVITFTNLFWYNLYNEYLFREYSLAVHK